MSVFGGILSKKFGKFPDVALLTAALTASRTS